MTERAAPWALELTDLVRAASGGLLFGIPLLFTVEVFWTGEYSSPARTLVVVALCFIPLIVLNRTEGFRSRRDVSLPQAVMDSVEGVAVAALSVLAVLVLLGEIDTDTPMRVILGKTAYEMMPFCIGVGLARNLLRGHDNDDSADEDSGSDANDDNGKESAADPDAPDGGPGQAAASVNPTLVDVGASVIGSVFVGLSIASTDEVPLLAASRSPVWLVAIMLASITIAYAIVFVADFDGQSGRSTQTGLLQRPMIETIVSYVAGLATAYTMLAIFQRVDGPWSLTASHVIVLGLPAAIGGAAGRLVV